MSSNSVPDHASHNIQTVASIEKRFVANRSPTDAAGRWITTRTGRLTVVALHAVFFAVWIGVNSGIVPVIQPFDRFPFQFLTFIVSLEVIFLSFFVLMGQNAQSAEADRWAHLDLQVNMLAEQEMTQALRMLKALCLERGLRDAIDPSVDKMIAHTQVEDLAASLETQRPKVVT